MCLNTSMLALKVYIQERVIFENSIQYFPQNNLYRLYSLRLKCCLVILSSTYLKSLLVSIRIWRWN